MREEIPYKSHGPGKIWIGLKGEWDKEAQPPTYEYKWFANGYDGPTSATPDTKTSKRAWTDWHKDGNKTKGDCGILMAYGEANVARKNGQPTVPKANAVPCGWE